MSRSTVIGTLWCLAGCSPEPAVSDAELRSVLGGACALPSCHSGAAPAGGLDLTSLEGLEGVSCEQGGMPLVSPGDPDTSWLWLKVDPDAWVGSQLVEVGPSDVVPMGCPPSLAGMQGTLMPPGHVLSEDDLEVVRLWIEQRS